MKYVCCLIALCFFCRLHAVAQVADTTRSFKDSVSLLTSAQVPALERLLVENVFLNSRSNAISMAVKPRKEPDSDIFFYLLTGVVLVFGIAKAAYSRYFSNLFRVFFNSSLRQSQLTDQLVQDQLPSLVFNSLFVVSSGLYVYFLMRYFNLVGDESNLKLAGICVMAVAATYLVKYLVLKFTGWITGYKQEADIYTFIIFLINKIIGICLLPVIIVLAFSAQPVTNIFVVLSFALTGLFLLMRFFRSYGLLQTRIRVSRFHFFLYIFAVEILPLCIIYKAVLLYFNRNV